MVLWKADAAQSAYMTWDSLPLAQAFCGEAFNNVPWETFVEPLAPSFEAFVSSLVMNEDPES